ncbi:MAG: response regulator receiver protein [Micrococcaceae bacterium]|nr:response regulator receiver protein [Micrococcaceae bacterium]
MVNHLQDLVLKSSDVHELLDELVRFSTTALVEPAPAFSSITLMRGQKPMTVASSAERAIQLDETQYRSGDGPCLTAIRERTIINVPDVSKEDRWPDYRAASRRVGVASSLSVPLVLEGDTQAGLNMYSTKTQGFNAQDIGTIEAYALRVTKVLRLAVRISQLREVKTHLVAAVKSRTIIDQAVGAIMARNRCDRATAVKTLNIAAKVREREVADVAASVLASIPENPTTPTPYDR